MRLPSRLHIKASREFARIKKEGSTQPGRFLVVSVLRDSAEAGFRFGLVTTRKIGGAVVRNRVRRLFREVIRDSQDRLVPGLLVVIIARWRSPDATLEELKRDWLKTAARAGILRAEKP
jgi:ribonuclease P protein component